MKFIKIQYNNEIHKIMLPSNDFSYNDLCELILQSFYLKDGYLIKYKDLEKNEIIIGNNDDLIKAFDQFYMQKFVKFFVYNADLLESDKEEEEEKSEKINMEIKDVQELFSASFDEAKLFKKMKEKMTEFISLNDFKNKKYEINTDYNQLSLYFRDILMKNFSKMIDEISPKTKNELINEKKQEINLDNESVLESIYELVERDESDSSPEPSFLLLKPNLGKSISEKYEKKKEFIIGAEYKNGRARFGSNILEDQNHLKSISEISFDNWTISKN